MIKTFKYRLYPNQTQQEFLDKNFGCVRFVYNLSLSKCIKGFEENKAKFDKFKLSRDIAELKN